MINDLHNCIACPRNCKIDRYKTLGFCDTQAKVKIATACLHFGEEPLITCFGGSGTIFFTGCTLRCSFCQNYQISQQKMGDEISIDEFVKICLLLQEKGAENINLVTPSHYAIQLVDFIKKAKDSGVVIPFCWNSSAYEKVEVLEKLRGLVTIWLPDLKTLNADLASKLFKAKDYPQVAKDAISWMVENNPLVIETKSGREKMTSGVIIRHLFLPSRLEDTIEVLSYLKENADKKAVISLMSQYTPVNFSESDDTKTKRMQSLSVIDNRIVSTEEDNDLRDLIDVYDFEYLFYQDLVQDTQWLPDFTRIQPFSNKLATPVWHWSQKFL